ncbi:unnamed protein product [Sphagnum jensenii]|jgi:hypothetical protein|uniref:Uncharacterized protein n=1 Tax=Sphagnum jensenii TaxID=128206 RepID=A0ABP0W239_9BRYO
MALIVIVALLIMAVLDGTQLQVAAAVRLRVPGSVDPHSRLSNSKRADSGDGLPVVQVNDTVDVQAAPSVVVTIAHGQQSEGVPRNQENLGRFEVEGIRRNYEDLVIFEGTPLNGTVGKRIVGENSSNVHQRRSRILLPSNANSPIPGSPGGNPTGNK